MGNLRLIEIIAAQAHDDPIFLEKLERIASIQSILSSKGPVSTFQLTQFALTPEGSNTWSEYSRLCGEVATRVNEMEGNSFVQAETIMNDLSLISPIVARLRNRQIPPLRAFLPKWILASIVGITFGVFAGQVPAELLENFNLTYVNFETDQAIVGLVLGAVIGVSVGFSQWFVIRRYIVSSYFWIIATGLGWSLGFAASVWIAFEHANQLIGIFVGIFVGLLQSIVVRREGWFAKVWFIISTAAYFIGFIIGEAVYQHFNVPVPLYGEVVSGFIIGLITGIPLTKHLETNATLPELPYSSWQSAQAESDVLKSSPIQTQGVTEIASDIETGKGCELARLDDLFFLVPTDWAFRKVRTGHWEFVPRNLGEIFITVMFLNTGGKDSADDLMREVEAKAVERKWTFPFKNMRTIGGKVDAIDVLTLAENGVTHRLVNFCYNGLEYFIDVKSVSLEEIESVMPILDAWFNSFELREPGFC